MRTGTTWIFLTLIQANQSDGISPELEEKIHEMQVEMQKKIIRVFISKFEIPDWQVVRKSIVIQLRSTGVRKVHVNGAREHKLPAAGIFSKIHEKENTWLTEWPGAVDVPLLFGLRGDHQRLSWPRCVRVCKRRVRSRTGRTRCYLNVSIRCPVIFNWCPKTNQRPKMKF